MISALETSEDGTVETQVLIQYDVFGNRLEEQVWTPSTGWTTTRYAYDAWDPATPSGVGNENWKVWATLDGNNDLETRYLNGDGLDQVFAQISANGSVAWYLTDRLGSTRELVDNNGNLLDAISYDAWGNITSQTEPSSQPLFMFTGIAFDATLGLYFNGNGGREYDPETGRFIEQDPMRFRAGDSNLYRYVGNDPRNATDPSGEYSWSEIWSGIWSPIQAAKGKAAADEAFNLAPQAAREIGVSGTAHNGPEDALRHAIWNALMTQRIGATRAKEFADAHESNSDNQDETLMDLWNNAVGRKIGASNPDASPERIVELVLEAYKNGELRVLRKTGSGRVPDGTPLLPSGEVATPGAKPSDPARLYYVSPYRSKPPAGKRDTRPYRYPGSPYKVGPPP